MMYRLANKRELARNPTCKAYGMPSIRWWEMWLPMWFYYFLRRGYTLEFGEMHEHLEPGDSFMLMGGMVTYDGNGERISRMAKLFDDPNPKDFAMEIGYIEPEELDEIFKTP